MNLAYTIPKGIHQGKRKSILTRHIEGCSYPGIHQNYTVKHVHNSGYVTVVWDDQTLERHCRRLSDTELEPL